MTSSWWDNIEIVPRSASKGSALQALAKSLNIPMDEVMVFGDSDNDLSMLKAAGVSVAMGNANERVRASARFETLTNDAQASSASGNYAPIPCRSAIIRPNSPIPSSFSWADRAVLLS